MIDTFELEPNERREVSETTTRIDTRRMNALAELDGSRTAM